MSDLAQSKCIPCESDIPALTNDEIQELIKETPDWKVVEVDGIPRIKRTFSFKNFQKALDFANAVGAVAEEQGHHPLFCLTWGEVTVEWWTHNIKGLHQNDFIMAAKTDRLFR
jgi:4a-hydroxytetrahydrobiopterin dehydratase